MSWRSGIQTVVGAIYPATCLTCANPVEGGRGLCTECWPHSHFISGLVCDACGCQLIGASNETELCDDCLSEQRGWTRGRSVFAYQDGGARLVWDLKYRDRPEIATTAGAWLLAALKPILPDDPLIAPIPLHWTRLLKRKYNQSELLSAAMCRAGGLVHAPRLLKRVKRTPTLLNLDKDERAEVLAGAIVVTQKMKPNVQGRNVVLVDDVMTSGATMNEAAKACLASGAASVSAVFLARAAKND